MLKYKNAKTILPQGLLKEIQQYVRGEMIYVPGDDLPRAGWAKPTAPKKDMPSGIMKSLCFTKPASASRKLQTDTICRNTALRGLYMMQEPLVEDDRRIHGCLLVFCIRIYGIASKVVSEFQWSHSCEFFENIIKVVLIIIAKSK